MGIADGRGWCSELDSPQALPSRSGSCGTKRWYTDGGLGCLHPRRISREYPCEQLLRFIERMSAPRASVLAVRCLLNFHISVLPVIRSLTQW